MITRKPEFKLGEGEPLNFRQAANGIWNKLNLALSLVEGKHAEQLKELLIESRAVADAIVHHAESARTSFVCCNVLESHCRKLDDGQVGMLDPILSGNVYLPYDEQTKMALKKKWLVLV